MEFGNCKVKFSPEEELILCCARTKFNSEIQDKISSLLKKDLDWSYIFNTASEHRLVPLLHLNLNKYSEQIPERFLSDLEHISFVISKKNFILSGKLHEILNLLNSNGIKAIPYKGPVLALLAYGDLAFREFDDLDIFMEKDHVFRATELLHSIDYNPLYPLNSSQMELLTKFQHEYKLIQDKPRMFLELHWDFYVNHLNNDLIYENKHYAQVKGNGFNFPTFAPEELILILSLHASGHFWEYLGWICDIAQIIETYNELDWDKILDKASKSGITRILGVSLSLVKELIGTDIPDEVLCKFEKDKKVQSISCKMQKNLFNKGSSNMYQNALDRIELRENIYKGIKDYMSYKLNPQTNEIANSHIPTSLYPLYYAKRIFNEIKSKKGQSI